MTVRLIRADTGELFVVDGSANVGWYVHRVHTQQLARYQLQSEAFDAIAAGTFNNPAFNQEGHSMSWQGHDG